MFLVILAALVSMKPCVDACSPSGPSHPFNLTFTNRTKKLGYLPELTIVKLGARRGIEECQKLFKYENRWKCTFNEELVDPELPIFVNTTLPYGTPETAFLHAISAAAITYEFTLKCRHNIRGCKCARPRSPPWSRRNGISTGCGDNIEFGISRTKSFFDQLEKGNDARTAMNLHNNKVGREVVRSSLVAWCRCHGLASNCNIKTCWKILAPFKDIGAELKKKYDNAVPVWFKDNMLIERIDDQSRTISSGDKRLVYLVDPSSDYCVRNGTSGTPEMLGKTCRSDDSKNRRCKLFIALCSSCGLKPKTVEHMSSMCKKHFITTCTR